MKKGQEDNITKEIKIDETITAPIEAGQKIGTMTISRDGEVIADIDLNASSAVEKKGIGLIIKTFSQLFSSEAITIQKKTARFKKI